MKYYFVVYPPESEVDAVAEVARKIAPYFVCEHVSTNAEDEKGFALELWGLLSVYIKPDIPWYYPAPRLRKYGDESYNRDVFGDNPRYFDNLGWKVEYLDTHDPGATQRHHFTFWFAAGVMYPTLKTTCEVYWRDIMQDRRNGEPNGGDARLGWAAQLLGESTREILPGGDVSIELIGGLIDQEFAQ